MAGRMPWSDSQPDFPDVTGWRYFGGPLDGEPFVLEIGVPPPSQESRDGWTGHYAMNRDAKRYEWREGPMRD
jgi:hypothetical protein